MTTKRFRQKPGWIKSAVLCAVIVGIGAVLIVLIFNTEPVAQREGATKETAMLAETVGVESGTFRPTIVATGSVIPAKDIILRPRVGGEIIELAPAFTPGGFVEKGETLLRIDPADYKNSLQQRRSELQQSETALQIEMGRQTIAEEEYSLFEGSFPIQSEELVLRQPQLNAAKAQVESARAALEQAKLELQRTHVVAPFDAHILTRAVNVGSQVSPGDALGRLVGVNTYWVEAMVPLAKLHWLSLSDTPEDASEVRIYHRTAWPPGAHRTGFLYKMIGELESETRLARVLVAVQDPLAQNDESAGLPALIIGSFVQTYMQAREIADVIRLRRDYLRNNETVWVMQEGLLAIRDVDVVFRDAQYVYIKQGLATGEQVVTTNLSTVVEGAPLRLKGSAGDTNE